MIFNRATSKGAGAVDARTEKPLTGRAVLVCTLAFFGVIIGANATLTVFAIGTLPGTEVESVYKAGIAYNAEIAAARSQDSRGLNVAGHLDRAPDGRTTFRVEARDAAGAPAAGLAFAAHLERPIDKRADRVVALSEGESGIYRGELSDIPAGQWDLVLEAESGTERVFLSKNRVLLK